MKGRHRAGWDSDLVNVRPYLFVALLLVFLAILFDSALLLILGLGVFIPTLIALIMIGPGGSR